MVEQFREDEIEVFRECFFFHARPDATATDKTEVLKFEGLKTTLRSVGCVPTSHEVKSHLRQYNGKVTFPNFLEILHKQRKSESNLSKDILEGFLTHDSRKKGLLPIRDVAWMLQNFGERLSSYEVDQLLREGRAVVVGGNLNYKEFVKNLCGSLPPSAPQNKPLQNGYSGEPVPDY